MTDAESLPARGIRARARAELTRAIVETARRHLASEGAAGLSLRAVARELGMVSSAVYRYVPSRDDLLTLLIVDAYDALGAAAEKAEARVLREDLTGRFVAVGRAVRAWALDNPHEYALIYGSPVPGYAAPQDTIAPATRVTRLFVTILVDAVAGGAYDPDAAPDVPPAVHRALAPLRAAVPPNLPDDLLLRGLVAWSGVFGAVSFELFGQFRNVVADAASLREAFFTEALRRTSDAVGLRPGPTQVPEPRARSRAGSGPDPGRHQEADQQAADPPPTGPAPGLTQGMTEGLPQGPTKNPTPGPTDAAT